MIFGLDVVDLAKEPSLITPFPGRGDVSDGDRLIDQRRQNASQDWANNGDP